jgi:DNA-binding transcriptional LysR family regulator
MVVSLATVVVPAVEMLKASASQATVLVEEGDLTQLLPKLRIGELDLFVGRLEPGYASPDLVTEALYEESMVAVTRPDHPLARQARATWADLAKHPCVLPPPWASLRVKLEQQFFKHDLHPPGDVVETASFLAQLSFLHERDAIAFMATSVARHFERLGVVHPLRVKVPVDLPPVGIITLRGQQLTATTQEFMHCVRRAAKKRG